MHATQLLDRFLALGCQGIHGRRWRALMACVGGLLRGRKLSVTGLGRALQSPAYEKHNIKRSDRLMGNRHLHRERQRIFQALAAVLVGPQSRPVMVVDWSDLSANREYQLLRASLPQGGRALTVYEETHPQGVVGNPRIHETFLRRLEAVLPAGCRPIVVTDAGFRSPWFRAVQALGWDFVGRVGGHTMVRARGQAQWVRVEQVFATATSRARHLGAVDLVRRQPLACEAYLVKKRPQGRVKRTVFGQRCRMRHSEKNAHRERTPWLLVTSVSGGPAITGRVLSWYRQRMQIEESFRDLKNSRWGFSLDQARVHSAQRYDNLLLIGSLATFAVWLVGRVAEAKRLHRRFQANTVSTRKVLSTFFLGCRVLDKKIRFSWQDYTEAWAALGQQPLTECQT